MNKYTQDNCASKAILSQLAVAKETVQSSVSSWTRVCCNPFPPSTELLYVSDVAVVSSWLVPRQASRDKHGCVVGHHWRWQGKGRQGGRHGWVLISWRMLALPMYLFTKSRHHCSVI